MSRELKDQRRKILDAALKVFAHNGYTGASVQEIVDRAGVTKPTLYYHFGSKAGLFQALVGRAADERYQLMCEAAARHSSLEDRLTAVAEELIEFASDRRDLMRVVFQYWFSAPGEIPRDVHCKKSARNRDFFRSLIREGIKSGQLDRRFDAEELANGIVGQIFLYSMSQVLDPRAARRRDLARRVVRLFLDGAGCKKNFARRAA